MNQVPWEAILSRVLQFLPFLIPLLKWYRERKGDQKTARFMNGVTIAYLEATKELRKGKRLTRKFAEELMRKGLEKREERGVVRVRMGG
jgi:hypothetical protein